ncbi:MAG: hypothetical protein KF832_29580 [Caldilineaceae bacterium]|nr:hypothetical protein [Caldilineaceae bacterium]
MKGQRDTASFVLRFTHDLWRDQEGEPRIEWRGQVRRVQDGEERRFTDLTDAMNFIQESLVNVTMNAVPKEDKQYQDKAVRESLKMWEKFAENYTSLMVDAMEQTVKQSETFQRQFTDAVEAMKPWWMMGFPTAAPPKAPESEPPAATQAQILQTLAALQAQLSTINEKVSKLEAQLQERKKSK